MSALKSIRREWLLLAIIAAIALAVGVRAPVFLTWRNGMDIANDSRHPCHPGDGADAGVADPRHRPFSGLQSGAHRYGVCPGRQGVAGRFSTGIDRFGTGDWRISWVRERLVDYPLRLAAHCGDLGDFVCLSRRHLRGEQGRLGL